MAAFDKRAFTGSLKPMHEGWWVWVCATLGLVSAHGAWESTWQRSWLYRFPDRLRRGVSSALAPFVGTSIAAELSPLFTLLSLCALLLASPYVGTGMNALLVLVSFSALIFQLLVNPPLDHGADALDIPFIVLLFISILAVGFSPHLVLSVKGLAKMLVFWMSYFSFRSALQRGQRAWIPLFAALFVAAFAQSLYGIYQWKIQVAPLALWDDAEAEVKLTRVYGTLRNPNLLSGYLIPIIPFAVAAALTWRNLLLRALAIATALAAPVCLYFTYSRGAYLALAAEGAVLFVLGLFALVPIIRRKPWLGVILGGALIVAILASIWAFQHSPAMQERILSITATRTHSSNSFRLNVWDAVKHMIRDSWWAGIGLGNDAFRRVYALYMISGFEALGAYNIFLEEAVEKGVFGLLAFLSLVVAAGFRALYHFFRGEEKAWAAAGLAVLVGLMIHGMVDTVFYRPSVQILFWLTLAVILHLPHRERGAL